MTIKRCANVNTLHFNQLCMQQAIKGSSFIINMMILVVVVVGMGIAWRKIKLIISYPQKLVLQILWRSGNEKVPLLLS